MARRLLSRLRGGPRRRPDLPGGLPGGLPEGLLKGPIDDRRLVGCLRALGVVGLTLLASLLLLVAFAVTKPNSLRTVNLVGPPAVQSAHASAALPAGPPYHS